MGPRVPAVAVEITFVSGTQGAGEAIPAEGVVRLPDSTLRAFSGWMELLTVLEQVAAGLPSPSR